MEVAQKFEALTGGKLVEGFGMTEMLAGGRRQPDLGRGARRLDWPAHLQHASAAICALEPDEDGKFVILPQGEEGEVILKGPQVMKGYWKMPDETAKTIDSDGWLYTGDIGKMDADGYFYIVDRKKDMIIASGFNIFPREVEEVLFEHPKVLEAAVAGIPDAKRGETVKAYVVLEAARPPPTRSCAFCKEQLAAYKVPTSGRVPQGAAAARRRARCCAASLCRKKRTSKRRPPRCPKLSPG